MHTFEQLINCLAPHRCISCLEEGSLLCDPCSTSVSPPAPRCYKCGKSTTLGLCTDCRQSTHLTMLVAVTSYDGPAKQLIHALKFERARAAADPIARLMKQRMPPLSPGTIICPIPTAHRRVRQRGYDQSVLIARQLAGALELPCHSLLRRTSATRQVGKNRLQRGEQLYQAFQVVRSFPPTATILLVDDVVTTGSTIDAAAAVMHQAGSQHLAAAVFAMA